MTNVTDSLVERILAVRDAALVSDELDDYVAMALLDHSAVTSAGLADLSSDGGGRDFLAALLADGTSGRAFALAFAAHRLELDDGYRKGGVHIGASVLSAIIACVPQLTWRELVASVAAGYEAAGRLAEMMRPFHKRRGFHATGTCGCVGVAAALSVAYGLDARGVKLALSAAAGMAAGILEMQEDGSQMKPVAAGNAASCGFRAVLLARGELRCPEDALGGPRGVIACMGADPHMASLDGGEPVITQVYRKLYPSCRHGHSALDAAREVRLMQGFDAHRVAEVDVATYVDAISGHNLTEIRTSSQGSMSIPFCVGAMLAAGEVGISTFEKPALNDQLTLDIMAKVHMSEDARLSSLAPESRGARVTVRLDGGLELGSEVLNAKGEPENPLTEEELMKKCIPLMLMGGMEDAQAIHFAEELFSPNRMQLDEIRDLAYSVDKMSDGTSVNQI